ncbi:TonB-dependent receptor [Rhizorhabdus argentea]|uniref:TonB-dependent receptor n=1 Tax=Rhizorhabdus argentea TaxID=1387174 RepID=UPI0030EF78BA
MGIDAGAAYAQSAEGGTATNIGEIVVTAQKREQRLQDVPATIAAFSQETLETRQIRGLGDLTTRVPSLVLGYQFGSNQITLRGISTGLTSGFEDASVAVHVNGVYQARARSLDLAQMDMERIEVLSGPQGTLYGRNATGGVINYILRGPTKETEAEVTGSLGNRNAHGVRGFISGPINDKVGFRITGLWDNADGDVKNLLVGAPRKRFGGHHVAAIRGVLAFKPVDTLHIDVEGTYSHTRASYAPTALAPSINPGRRAFLVPQTYLPHKVYSDLDAKQDTTQYSATGTVTWDVSDDIQLKSISGYQKYRNFMNVDYDASGANAEHIPSRGRSNTYSQELDLSTSMFDGRLQSIYGAFYFNDNYVQQTNVFSSLFGGSNVDVYQGNFSQKAKSIAFFTDHTFSVTDRFRLLAGIRFNHDNKKAVLNIRNQCSNIRPDLTFEAWTPRAGVQFDVSSEIKTYATYQKGFKSGGIGSGTCGDTFKPETIEGGEAGVKASLVDNRIHLNVAGFWYDYKNLQVQKTLGTAGGFKVQNAAAARIKGLEASFDASITDRLKLDGSAMVESAKYTNYVNCNPADFLGACTAVDTRLATDPTRNRDLAGNWLNRAPPYSISIGAQYGIDLAGGELLLRGESYWSGKVRFSEFNDAVLTQRAYNIQNAYVTFTSGDEKYVVRGFIKNIGNTNYRTSGYFDGFVAQRDTTWGSSRTFGGEVTLRF